MKEKLQKYLFEVRFAFHVHVTSRIQKVYAKVRNRVWSKLYGYAYDDRALYEALVKNQKAYDKQARAFNKNICALAPTHEIAIEVIKQLKPIRSIVGIQPMAQPVDKPFLLRYRQQTGNQLMIQIVTEVAEAKSRKFAARLPLNATKQDKKNLAIAMAQELTDHILNGLRAIAQREIIEVLGSDKEIAQRIAIRLNRAANDIARDTRRGAGNAVVLTQPLFKRIGEHLKTFAAFKPAEEDLITDIGLKHVGTINGTIKLFVSMESYEGEDSSALVAYKGQSEIDTGYIFSPYHLVMGSGQVAEGHTTMCRFGDTVDDDSPKYYRELIFRF